jgi:hypothetical protein
MRNGKERKMKRLWLAGLALTVGVLVLVGCGGGSGGSGSSESSTTTAEASGSESKEGGPVGFEISAEDRQCLKEKGVELPEFKAGEGPQTFRQGETPEGGEMPAPPEGGQVPEGGEAPEGGPPTRAGGAITEANKEAFEECGVEMPEFKGGPGGGARPNVNSAAFKKQVKEYVACVRENGYELAEPDFSGEGPIFEKSESESAAFKKASEQCQGLLGGPQGSQSG